MRRIKQQYLQKACFLLMVLACLFVLLPASAKASEIKRYGDFKYCYNEEYEGIEITKYKGTKATVRIPETIDGIPVKVIGKEAFRKNLRKNKTMKKVIIPESVVSIKESAFIYCLALKSVTLPENLQELGEDAFYSCKNLKKINIPKKLEVLSEGCFADTGLKEVTIPKNIRKIDLFAFSGCKNLKRVTFEKKSKLEFMGWQAFVACYELTSIKIPKSVETLDQEAFEQCRNLKTVTFEKGSKLKEIGYGCFEYCDNLTSIKLPASVKILDPEAFIYCKKLKKVTFQGPAPKIRTKAFKGVNPELTFQVPKKYKADYTKILKRKKWFKSTMKIVSE